MSEADDNVRAAAEKLMPGIRALQERIRRSVGDLDGYDYSPGIDYRDADDEPEHEIEAYYSNLPGPEQTRVLACSCGFTANGRDWMEAGMEMDEHVSELA